MGQKRRWTKEEFERLERLAEQIPRPSTAIIAKQLNRSRSAIKNKLALFPSVRTNKPYTKDEIALQLNRSRDSVAATARRLGLRRYDTTERTRLLTRAKTLREQGLTWKETVSIINKEFGKQYKPITLRQRLHYYQVI